ncbi:TonB-dependent receptor domain-containing protein [Acinetobacter johnsonii]|uniref:TonB-dependent receptor domain-containing protein n=1 Tax=Acinetobacter johnsonii TaxID=40214 RepID=UPI003985488D
MHNLVLHPKYQINYVSYGTAFRSPTFNDLYYPGWSNPNLQPEESENIEVGFKGSQLLDWELIGFVNKIDNLIANQNNGQAKIKGVELSLGQNFDAVSWNVNYTYQDPENQNPTAKGKQLTFKPAQILNASLDYKIEDWTLGGSVHAEDQRYTNDQNTAKLAGFAIADVRVAYQVNPEFSVQAKLANMFDKEYYTQKFYTGDLYRQEGRTVWLTLRYAMK